MGNFSLFHTALYAKGWYKREDNKTIWEDLKVILSLDDYNGDYMTKYDIVNVVLYQCQRIKEKRAFTDLCEFANGISKDYCWKHGYITKGNATWFRDEETLPEYDYYEAIIRYCLSNLSNCEVSILCGEGNTLPKPDFEKGLPSRNEVQPNDQ